MGRSVRVAWETSLAGKLAHALPPAVLGRVLGVPETTDYKPTLFDRHGPVAGMYIQSAGHGLIAFLFVLGVTSVHGMSWRTFAASLGAGILTGGLGPALGYLASRCASHVVFGGSSTPYVPQHSYQDSLIQQGRLAEALESFEALIAEQPSGVDVRIRAAELYVKNENSVKRAAELFREVQRIDGISIGNDVYATNRLVDLFIGPLDNPSRALVELRRLIDRYPGTSAANRARDTLAILKARYLAPVE